MARLLVALLPLARCQPAQFLGRYLLGESGQQCVGNDRPCEDGVDCCGVCAYIGANSWRCLACTEVGDECIPMGNRCCNGGNKQKDLLLSNPQHSCQATAETSEKYGTTKYTCQAVNASISMSSFSSDESESNMSAVRMQASASTGRGVETYVRYRGKATDKQAQDLRDFAYQCFQRHPVRTTNLGELQGSLGSAIGCVLRRCRAKWGWKPVLSQSGSDNGGPYDSFGRQSTVTVDTSSGKWQFVLKMQGSSHGPRPSPGRAVTAYVRHRGDATQEQARDLRQFAGACFKQHAIETSNVGALDASLGRAISCVTSRCRRKWGWKPYLSQEGSDNGGPYGAYGRGATVVGVETSSGKWQFVLRLKS